MAEIKSTIDLIMERTRNLTLSDEERNALHREEAVKKAKGSIQRFLDGARDPEVFREAVETDMQDDPSLRAILAAEVRERVRIEGENGPLFQVARHVLGMDPGPWEVLLEDFRGRLAEARISRQEEIRKALADRGVSGSAVMPNPARDEVFQGRLDALNRQLQKALTGDGTTSPG